MDRVWAKAEMGQGVEVWRAEGLGIGSQNVLQETFADHRRREGQSDVAGEPQRRFSGVDLVVRQTLGLQSRRIDPWRVGKVAVAEHINGSGIDIQVQVAQALNGRVREGADDGAILGLGHSNGTGPRCGGKADPAQSQLDLIVIEQS